MKRFKYLRQDEKKRILYHLNQAEIAEWLYKEVLYSINQGGTPEVKELTSNEIVKRADSLTKLLDREIITEDIFHETELKASDMLHDIMAYYPSTSLIAFKHGTRMREEVLEKRKRWNIDGFKEKKLTLLQAIKAYFKAIISNITAKLILKAIDLKPPHYLDVNLDYKALETSVKDLINKTNLSEKEKERVQEVYDKNYKEARSYSCERNYHVYVVGMFKASRFSKGFDSLKRELDLYEGWFHETLNDAGQALNERVNTMTYAMAGYAKLLYKMTKK